MLAGNSAVRMSRHASSSSSSESLAGATAPSSSHPELSRHCSRQLTGLCGVHTPVRAHGVDGATPATS